jgi:methyl-accepting chemotaxis protein
MMDSAWTNGNEYGAMWSAIAKGATKFARMKLVGKNSTLWVQSCFAPVGDGEGEVSRVTVFCVDVTAEVMQNLDFSGQVEAIRRSQGVMTFALDGTILDANDICLHAMGYTLNEVKGRHHRMFVSKEYVFAGRRVSCGTIQATWKRKQGGVASSVVQPNLGYR